MAELWQAYGGWVLYAAFFASFAWLHLRMHAGGHGGHGCGHAGHAGTHEHTARPEKHRHDHCGRAGHSAQNLPEVRR